MFEQGVEEEVRAAGDVAPQVLGLDAVRTLPREEAIAELERATLASPPTSASGCAGSRASSWIDAERPAGEWRMRFWKWHALGNSYLVVEEAVAPELARRLCDVRYGIGSDGVVEVVAANGAQAEIVIWNPDGSVAEFSGNGSRIAAAWLGARAATPQVTIGVAGRTYPAAIRDDGTVAMGVGEVEVGETETIELGDERIELTAVSVGTRTRSSGSTRAATTCSGSAR